MKFNIARQTLVPAFLTLVALAAFAMWSAGSPAGDLPVGNPSPTGGELALSTPAELLARFQAACPGWSRWIGGFLILFVGMSLGRLTVRYNLYSVGTCLAIPLYGAITAGLLDKESFLTTLTAATLLALASRNYARSFCNGYGFDALFRASLYLGILMLIVPAALPFVLILPLAVALFRRTLRETVVAIAGLLLPILTFCYLNWGAGGDFIDPLLRGYADSPLLFPLGHLRRGNQITSHLHLLHLSAAPEYSGNLQPRGESRHHSTHSHPLRRSPALPFRPDSPDPVVDRLHPVAHRDGRNRYITITYLVQIIMQIVLFYYLCPNMLFNIVDWKVLIVYLKTNKSDATLCSKKPNIQLT